MSQCNILGPASYAALLAGILYGVQKEVQEGGSEVTLLLASILIVLLLFTMSFYATFVKTGCNIMASDAAVVMRALCSALFTTDLFVKNQVLGDMWNYLPLVIVGVLGVIYLMQGDSECDRSFMQLYQVLNMVAQLYVACKVGQLLTGIAAFSLLMAYSLCTDGEGFMNVSPAIWYNFLAGAFCLTANGQSIALKSD